MSHLQRNLWACLNLGHKIGPNDRFELSSVWLAKDHEASSYVAMKILTGHATDLHRSGMLQELDILRHLKSSESSHCLQLLANFEYSGASDDDGNHICLVTELCATNAEHIWKGYDRLMPIPLAKRILRDVVIGLCEMHAAGCVHTDLKSDNIMCRSPLFTSSDAINALLASDPSQKNPPEESLTGTVQSAVSQPLATTLSLDEACGTWCVL
ncbi:hypothetical protein AX16_004049 [Volvariella volvacea WC 439]|nr:hypothetical protein AX16_004049 [Volvariella volvacea WC 439]